MSSNHLASKHIVFIAGEDEYGSEVTLAQLARDVEKQYGARVTVLLSYPDPSFSADIPNLALLKEADLAVMYLRFRQLPDDQLNHLLDYVKSGKPVVAFRTSTHAFQYPDDHPYKEWNNKFGIDVLGAPWIQHFGHSSSTDVSHAWGAENHPVLADVPAFFHVRSWLYQVLPYPPEGAVILLNGQTVDPELDTELRRHSARIQPVAWTRTNAWGGKVFMTTMGHPEDFEQPAFKQLVSNSLQWAIQSEE